MDTEPAAAGDLTDLERRLAGWRPSGTGLDAERMLFAAGQASVRPGRGRFTWPAVSVGLAVLAAALGAGLARERSARQDLIAQLRATTPAVVPAPPAATIPGPSPSPDAPAATSYLASRRALSEDVDAWPLRVAATPLEDSPSVRRVLKAHSPGELLEP